MYTIEATREEYLRRRRPRRRAIQAAIATALMLVALGLLWLGER